MQQDHKQNQDRRVKQPMQGDNQNQQQHQPQPQKCPRCESLNTKFCYYNNYSLSQPRYFCKTCRRYWTQGGTLRNVPVGGGCRKGKRVKTSSSTVPASSSSSENSRSQSLQQPQNLVTSTQNMITSTNSGNTVSLGLRVKESGGLVSVSGLSSMGSYSYSGGSDGFLMNSLAAIQSLNNQPPQPFTLNHQPANFGGDFGGGTSNLNLLHGFNASIPSFGSQQIHPQRQIYQMPCRDNKSTGDHPFYAASSSHQQQQNWPAAGFISSNTNPTSVSDTALWSVSTSTTIGNTNSRNNANGDSFPVNSSTDQWHHDLPDYGAPP